MSHRAMLAVLGVFAVGAVCTHSARAASSNADPVATQKALSALLAASNDLIPRSSSCHGDFGQPGKAKVKDLVAMRLAYLYTGSNVIEGSCTPKECSLSITHAAGEDVAAATITFALSGSKARASSLQCVITP